MTKKKGSLLVYILAGLGDSAFGYFAGLALFISAFLVLPMLASKWDGHLFDRKGCVQLQEINGAVFKVDSCSGDVQPLNEEELTNKSSVSSEIIQKADSP